MSDFAPLFEFEKAVADFWQSRYAVAVDCCTHALELCLHVKPEHAVCPTRTYASVPMMMDKRKYSYEFLNKPWTNYYYLTNQIIDAAPYWKRDGYVNNSLMCISFGHKKHINIGKGGMILLNDKNLYTRLQKIRYDGRSIHSGVMYKDDNISELGFHYYMTPETAAVGLEIFNQKKDLPVKTVRHTDYDDLGKMIYFADRIS